jgi:hypothetical protein
MSNELIPSGADSLRTLLASLVALVVIAFLTATPAEAAGQQGMVAVRDAQTGQLRAPTAAELKALQQQAPAQLQPGAAKATVTMREDGSGHLHLGEQAMVYAVMTRDAHGETVMQCVSGHEAAEAAVHSPVPVAGSNQERQHESR